VWSVPQWGLAESQWSLNMTPPAKKLTSLQKVFPGCLS